MPDAVFENARLVSLYDAFDGQRNDLEIYLALIEELGAKSVLDIGCGTGSFATLLAGRGIDVVGVEPAKASLDCARRKANAEKVQWILGDATTLPNMSVDIAIMTGNVAQVFLNDESWNQTLRGIRRALNRSGSLVFEVRNPAPKAWLEWTKEKTRKQIAVPHIGLVEAWCEVTDVSGDCVSFRWTFHFAADGATLLSDSTLRFRERKAIETSLSENGFIVKDVRDAPDRPGKEFVFIANPA